MADRQIVWQVQKTISDPGEKSSILKQFLDNHQSIVVQTLKSNDNQKEGLIIWNNVPIPKPIATSTQPNLISLKMNTQLTKQTISLPASLSKSELNHIGMSSKNMSGDFLIAPFFICVASVKARQVYRLPNNEVAHDTRELHDFFVKQLDIPVIFCSSKRPNLKKKDTSAQVEARYNGTKIEFNVILMADSCFDERGTDDFSECPILAPGKRNKTYLIKNAFLKINARGLFDLLKRLEQNYTKETMKMLFPFYDV